MNDRLKEVADKTGRQGDSGAQVPPSFGPTGRSLPIALLRARETIMIPIREMLQASGISEQQWRVLRVVDEAGEIEQSAIAQAACLQLPSLTRILRSMEGAGLVSRRTDEVDRRRTLVRISPAGKQLLASHRAHNAAIFTRLETAFGRERLDALLDLLDDLQQVRL
ncbi:MAG: homoprotocatechuate degradation operon regulator HpaR [Rhizobiaceae bacterium]